MFALLFCLGQNSGSILQFVSVKLITISTMAALFLGSLMLFGVALSWIVLRERLQFGSVMSLVVCLFGILILIAGPYQTKASRDDFRKNEGVLSIEFNKTSFNFNGTVNRNITWHNGLEDDDRIDLRQLIFGVALAVMAGFGEAVSVISLNCIQDDLENIHVLTFWFVVSGMVCSVPGMFAFEHEELSFPTELLSGCYLAGHVVTSSLALLCYIVAMENLSASLMSILASAQIPVNVLLQYAFFTQLQPMHGGNFELIGAGIVTLGLIIQPLMDLCQTNNITSDNETSALLSKTVVKDKENDTNWNP